MGLESDNIRRIDRIRGKLGHERVSPRVARRVSAFCHLLGLEAVGIAVADGIGDGDVVDTFGNTCHPFLGNTEVPEAVDGRDDLAEEPIHLSHSYPRVEGPMHDLDTPGEDSSTALEAEEPHEDVAGDADVEDVAGAVKTRQALTRESLGA